MRQTKSYGKLEGFVTLMLWDYKDTSIIAACIITAVHNILCDLGLVHVNVFSDIPGWNYSRM